MTRRSCRASGQLPQAQAHAEHLINIVEGSRGEMFGDWNSDGLVQNPGDDFGLAPYLRLLLRLMDPVSDASAIQLAETLDDDVESARDLAQRIAAADSLEEVAGLAQSLAAIDIETRISTLAGSLAGRSFGIGVEILSGAR